MNNIDNNAIIYDADVRESTIYEGTVIADGAFVYSSFMDKKVEIGRRSFVKNSKFGYGTYIGHGTSVLYSEIGKYCSISWGVSIVGGGNHDYKNLSTYTPYWIKRTFGSNCIDNIPGKKTVIGNDVWIGCNSVVLSGLTVGDGAVIGAAAVVTKDVAPYSIVVGNPAKEIGKRFSENIINELMQIQWWDFPEKILADNSYILHNNVNSITIENLKKIKQSMEEENEKDNRHR